MPKKRLSELSPSEIPMPLQDLDKQVQNLIGPRQLTAAKPVNIEGHTGTSSVSRDEVLIGMDAQENGDILVDIEFTRPVPRVNNAHKRVWSGGAFKPAT